MNVKTDFRAFCKGHQRAGGFVPDACLEIEPPTTVVAAVDDLDGKVYYYHLFDDEMYQELTAWCAYTFVDGDHEPRFEISKVAPELLTVKTAEISHPRM